ncbi:MAG: glutamate--tRNA ligase [Alphaproteobacteria bacterium]|nr:glutamate--tRNA ligase [Alphaproteobacteria bacterium]
MNIIEKINDLFPSTLTTEEIESRYTPRPEGHVVTRIAPSPTGMMHIGSVYAALISERVAHLAKGTFMLRIEDTDSKREVDGATEVIINGLENFNITSDEGPTSTGEEKGKYGPYTQSKRKDIYLAYIKQLLEKDLAYPCFCSQEELEEIRDKQTKQGMRTGYYGDWAKFRKAPKEIVADHIEKGTPFTIRLRSSGKHFNKRQFEDLIKGKRNLPENDADIVILKASGLPTYHFAHAIDDHFMGTTHVIRGDEWLSSLPLHIQLFETLGWKAPHFAHISPIEIMDDGKRRKLSKRKDPEASVTYYEDKGYPKEAVIEYLMNLANSTFEAFRVENPSESVWNFPFELQKLGRSGSLLDLIKLDSMSRDFIGRLSAQEVYDQLIEWAENMEPELFERMQQDRDYFINIFKIEREGVERVRKDFANWSTIWQELDYFFDDAFTPEDDYIVKITEQKPEIAKAFLSDFIENYDDTLDNEAWFGNMKELAGKHGFAKNGKVYKKDPDSYNGTIADAAKMLRVAITGKAQTPDLYSLMMVMGKERVLNRLNASI